MTTTYDCPTHGPYPRDQVRLYVATYDCPACDRDAKALETAWRAEWDRWRRAEASGIPARFARATLDAWAPADQLQATAKAVVTAWCTDMAEGRGDGTGLLFTGAPGLGKTHLAVACLIEVLRRTPHAVTYAQWPDTLTRIKSAFGNKGAVDLLEAAKATPVLALDEIGVRAGTEFDAAALFDLIDSRYRDGLPTLVCTNLTTKEFVPVLGERVADRLREMTRPVYLKGASRRTGARGIATTLPLPIVEPPHRIEVPQCGGGKMGARWITYEPPGGPRRREFA